jgi:hypothetical protein
MSEAMPATGGALADLMTAATSAANLDRTTVLLREVLQNSCDARDVGNQPITFLVHAFEFSDKQAQSLIEEFPRGTPGIDFSSLSAKGGISGLLFADTNTVGLRGTTDAGQAGEHANFSNFFFQIGRDSRSTVGGGAFGLGRTVLFAFSRCSTALVYSRFRQADKIRSRLMGMTLSEGFEHKRRKFTGRHWWGQPEAAPIEGARADKIAKRLGLDEAFTADDQTGTAVLIIQPVCLVEEGGSQNLGLRIHDAETRRTMIEEIRRAAELYAWPHMIGANAVEFHFRSDHDDVPLRDVRQDPVLMDFIAAYDRLTTERGKDRHRQISFSGREDGRGAILGDLSWELCESTDVIQAGEREGVPSNAIALLRQARFVVKYLEISSGTNGTCQRGAFLVRNSYEPVFRKSEPVTHDDWLPEKLGYSSGRRNEIKQAVDQIKKEFKDLTALSHGAGSAAAALPSIELANRLGVFFTGQGVHGPRGSTDGEESGSEPSRPSSKKPANRIRLEEQGTPRVTSAEKAGSRVEFEFLITGKMPDAGALPVAHFAAGVRTADDRRETEPPARAESPRVVTVRTAAGGEVEASSIQLQEQDLNSIVTVTVFSPPGISFFCEGELNSKAERV